MILRCAVLALCCAGAVSAQGNPCYIVSDPPWSTDPTSTTLTCDYDMTTCNPYLSMPRWVTIECAGHAVEQYPEQVDCVFHLWMCRYAQVPTNWFGVFAPPVSQSWEETVRQQWFGKHTETVGSYDAQAHHMWRPGTPPTSVGVCTAYDNYDRAWS